MSSSDIVFPSENPQLLASCGEKDEEPYAMPFL